MSHYLDHIQPAIDQLALADCEHFKELDPYLTPQECTAQEQSLERMRCFRRFQELVARGVDQWCQEAGVSEELLLKALKEALEQTKGGRETCLDGA